MADERGIGARQVAIVAIVAVAIVLGLEVITTVLPGARDLLAGTPLLIAVLIVGTAAVLWLIANRRTPDV